MTSDEVRRKIDSLSPTEREVLDLVCEGIKYKDIGDKIGMSESSVKNHMKAVRLKFGINYLSRREGFIELNNTYCSALKEIRDQSNKNTKVEKESKEEPKPKPQVKEKVPVEKQEIEKDKEIIKEKEKPNEREFEKIEKKDDVIPPFEKPKEPIDEKKDGYQMKKTDQPKRDRFRSLKTIWRVISIAAIIFSGYIIYDRFFGTSPIQPAPSPVEPETSQEEIVIVDTQSQPGEEIQPTAIPNETVVVSTESPSPEPVTQQKQDLPFEDTFDEGLSDAWEVVSGNPIIVNGMLSTDQDTWLMVGDPTWEDYSIEFKSDFYGYGTYSFGFNAIGVRASDIDNMYAYKWVEHESVSAIVQNGEWMEIPQSEFMPGNEQLNFRITIKDNKFSVFVNDELKTSFFDEKYKKGQVALKLHPETTIDDFKVREISD